MVCQGKVTVVQFRVVHGPFDNCRFCIIRNQYPGDSSIPFESINVGLRPADLCFIRECFDKWIGAVTKGADPEMSIHRLSDSHINHAGNLVTNPVDEQFFTGLSFLWHNNLFTGLFTPLVIQKAKMAVTVTFRMFNAILFSPDVFKIFTTAGLHFCIIAWKIRFRTDLFGP